MAATPDHIPVTVPVDVQVRVVTIEGVVIHPGDALLVQVDPGMDLKHFDELWHQLTDQLPGIQVVLVPTTQMAVKPGPQLDSPARPLVDTSTAWDRAEHRRATAALALDPPTTTQQVL